jgi:hypothetical protein
MGVLLTMTQRLTESQLNQIIAEVQRLADRQQDQFTPDQVKQVLTELNLPPELLDEAMIQVQRRQALERQERRNRWLMGGVAVIVMVAIGGTLLMMQQNQQKLDRIVVQQARITLTQDDGGDRRTITRQTNPEVVYRVTLKAAPVGEKLTLACDWLDPSHQVVKQNRYETQEITTPTWTTHCRYKIGPAMPTGTWKVRMLLGNRPIGDAAFDVK